MAELNCTRVVYKYEVHCCNSWTKLSLPKGAVILSAIHKEPIEFGDGIWIYAEIDPQQSSMESYDVIAIGTGREFGIDAKTKFLNTVRIPSPINEIYHVYYQKPIRVG